jgi:hypothetical protein
VTFLTVLTARLDIIFQQRWRRCWQHARSILGSFSWNNQRGKKPVQSPQTNTVNPCFCNTQSSFSDYQPGRFTPFSHFCTVVTLVFKWLKGWEKSLMGRVFLDVRRA